MFEIILCGVPILIWLAISSYQPDEYRRYLRSKAWKKKRMKRLKMDKFTCQRCGRKVNLQVHHKTYKNIYKEKMEDLETLCGRCHKKEHEIR